MQLFKQSVVTGGGGSVAHGHNGKHTVGVRLLLSGMWEARRELIWRNKHRFWADFGGSKNKKNRFYIVVFIAWGQILVQSCVANFFLLFHLTERRKELIFLSPTLPYHQHKHSTHLQCGRHAATDKATLSLTYWWYTGLHSIPNLGASICTGWHGWHTQQQK